MREYVCAAREQRADLLRQMSRDPIDDTAWERMSVDREAMLADFEQRLGSDRDAKLRAVGGLGGLGELLACDRWTDLTLPAAMVCFPTILSEESSTAEFSDR